MNEMRKLMEAVQLLSEAGDQYQLVTKTVVARNQDQEEQHVEVLTLTAGTRHGISQFQLALLEPEPVIVEYVGDRDGLSRVRLISGGSQPTVDYVHRPYTSKKTGATRPNIDLSSPGVIRPLEDTYPVLRGEMLVRSRHLTPHSTRDLN